jgi:hypothetical protein
VKYSLDLPKDLTLALTSRGFHFYNTDHTRELLSLDYGEIASWGMSKDILALILHKEGYQQELHFLTNMGRVIIDLAEAYVAKILDNATHCISSSHSSLRRIGLDRKLVTTFSALHTKIFK